MTIELSKLLLQDPIVAYQWHPPDYKGKVKEFHPKLSNDKSQLYYQVGDTIHTSHQNLIYVLEEYKKDCIVICETGDSGFYQDKNGDITCCPVVLPVMPQHIIKSIPSNFKHIFATNCSLNHVKWPQFTPLPIGVQKHQLEQIKLLLNSGYLDLFKRNLLYVNFQTETNPIRRPVARYWNDKIFPWAKINFNVRNNLPDDVSCFLNYLWVSQSAFTLCPEGNGLDSYRIWESMYLGAIPIVKDLPIYSHPEYQRMPLFKTKDLIEMKVNDSELRTFSMSSVDFSFLTKTYWNNLIKSKLNS